MDRGRNTEFKITNPNWKAPEKPISLNETNPSSKYNVLDVLSKSDEKQVAIQTEINNLKAELEESNYEKFHDSLTGCYNKHFFENFKEEDFDPINDHNILALIFADLNNLKQANDKFGHKAGDSLIRTNAIFLKNNLDKNGKLIRFGGDEFLFICRNNEQDPNFEENLTLKIDQLSLKDPNVDFSFGIAVYDRSKDLNLDNTLHRADILMYENKKDQKQKLSQEI